jgi:hypothetical protein
MRSVFIFFLLVLHNIAHSQDNADSILNRVSQNLNGLKNIKYHSTRELNYPSENYHRTSNWIVYYGFQSTDKIIGFKYQVEDSLLKQVFNGTESFELDKKMYTIRLNDNPAKGLFASLSVLYNSIITLKNILPLLIIDKTATRSATDTIIDNTTYTLITINIGKRRIQNLGHGFDAMTTKSNFIYKLILNKNNGFPFEVLQVNDLTTDFIKTSFTED